MGLGSHGFIKANNNLGCSAFDFMLRFSVLGVLRLMAGPRCFTGFGLRLAGFEAGDYGVISRGQGRGVYDVGYCWFASFLSYWTLCLGLRIH